MTKMMRQYADIAPKASEAGLLTLRNLATVSYLEIARIYFNE